MRQHLAHRLAERLVLVGVDPALVGVARRGERVQPLADLVVDLEAGQQRRHRHGEGLAIGGGQQEIAVAAAGRRGRRRGELLGAHAELAKEPLVQRPLDQDRVPGAAGELDLRLGRPRLGRGGRERAGEGAQIVRVLDHVEGEPLARQRAGGELAVERQGQDRVVDRRDLGPHRVGEAHWRLPLLESGYPLHSPSCD